MKKKCKKCGKDIAGKIKIHTYRKKSGSTSKVIVDYYDEDCFYILEHEKACNDNKKKRN